MRRVLVPWLSLLVFGLSACTCNKGPPPQQTLKNEGEPCGADDACATGLCDGPVGTQPVCVRKCATGCLAEEVCTQLTPGRFACQPDQRRLCQACEIDADCPYPSDKCVVVNGENVCGRDCAFDQSCPAGYQCVNARGTDGAAKVQQCTPVNASCACLARGDFQQPCEVTNAFGTCRGIKQCDLVANTVACDALTPAAEVCNGLDDDCDGTVDEEQPQVSCGVGACERLASSCADGGAATCMPGVPATETCNRVDDDCDGTVDNGFDTTTDVAHCGACGNACALPHATPACSGSQCVVQVCDPGWGNCDAQDPNGCEVELATNPQHCGSCGRACGQQNATATCVMGDCRYACNAGFIDLNMDPSDGCEYQCTPTSMTDVPDLGFVDANCDGIDGEVLNGVFVAPAPLGDDGHPGTRLQPKATVGAAILAAATTGKRDVYVAAGTYAGPVELNLSSNFNVAGGYSATTWQRASTNVVTIQGGNPSLKVEGAVNVLVQAMRFEGADGAAPDVAAYGGWVKDSTGVRLESVVLTAGNGAAGATGTAGAPGTPGGAGAGGTAGCVWDTRSGNFPLACQLGITVEVCNNGARPPGGGGGASACGYPGGGGGQPSHQDSTDKTLNVVVPGANGSPAPNGTGAAGQGVAFMVTPNGLPWFGGGGAAGSSGANGAAATAGALSASGWAPGHGGDGTSGTPGRGGGGGGGGAGGWVPILGDFGNPCQGYGSSGGGGGGGGCGGGGGQGGRGGGAAIGLFVSASTVTGQGVVVNAGNGGGGGAGGAPGGAGAGGAAGVSPVPHDSSQATRGGNGGAGGAGGTGGQGGGGAGGSVYGVARSASSTVTGVTVGTIGTAGSGGAAAAAGPAGARSLQVTF